MRLIPCLLLLLYNIALAQNRPNVLVILPELNSIKINSRCLKIISDATQSDEFIKKQIHAQLALSARNIYQANFLNSDFPELLNLEADFIEDAPRINEFEKPLSVWEKLKPGYLFSIPNHRALTGKEYSLAAKEKLGLFAQAYQVDYIISINLFETIIPKPFDKSTHFNIHVEIYNAQLQKVWADVLTEKVIIGRRVYFNTLKYFFRSRIDWIFSRGLPDFN